MAYNPSGWDFDPFDQNWLESQTIDSVGFDIFPDYQCTQNCSSTITDQVPASLDVGASGIDPLPSFDSSDSYGLGLETGAQAMLSLSALSALPTSLEVSSTKVTQDATPSLSDNHPKRKMEDFLQEFEFPRAAAIASGRKGPYGPEERKKVGQVRKVGACLRCRILRISCGVELPCESCNKLCNSITLGMTLCVRQKLLGVRQAHDLWNRQDDMEWIRNEITLPLQGPKKTFQLSLVNACDISPNFDEPGRIWDGGHDGPYLPTAPLKIEVQEFYPSPGREYLHTLIILEDSASPVTIENSYYAITPESLPTLDTLETWALDSTRFRRRVIFGDKLQGSFMSLARRYAECAIELPLAGLMRKAVQLSCLHAIWCSALPQLRRTSQEPRRYLSRAVHQQIGVIVSEGIETLEYDILNQLEELIFHRKGPGKENLLPIWTCLWLLMLTYRRTVVRWPSERWGDGMLALAQHMYEMLISIYSALFKPSSPLWLNFLKDEVFELFGRDLRVVERLGTIKTEMGYMQNDPMDFQSSLDAPLRSLILEHEKKLGRKAHEKAHEEALRMNVCEGVSRRR